MDYEKQELASPPGACTCAECGYTAVPTRFNDFYMVPGKPPDDLFCERCMFQAAGPVRALRKRPMSADLQALVASPWWRWMPGMLLLDDGGGVRVAGVCGEFIHGSAAEPTISRHGPAWMRLRLDREWLPDPTDPATLGCLRALAREAWGDPRLTPRCQVRRGVDAWWVDCSEFSGGPTYATEGEALIAAILAAPPPGGVP